MFFLHSYLSLDAKKIPTKTFAQQKCAIINCDVMNFPISIGEIFLVHLNICVY